MDPSIMNELKILLNKRKKIEKKLNKYDISIFKTESQLLNIGKTAPLTKSIEGYVFSKSENGTYNDEDRIFSKNLPKMKKREL